MRAHADIMIVDDDPLVQMNYQDILTDAGFNVISADSLAQARRELSGGRSFDLIVCDHDLGDGKGMALVAYLATLNPITPVIYLSAALPAVLQEAAAMAPVIQVLSKPVEPAYLLEIIRKLTADVTQEQHIYPSTISPDERNQLLQIFN